VVINGTCLDFLAEILHGRATRTNGGGFVILNGVKFDERRKLVPLAEPYRAATCFSLAYGRRPFLSATRKRRWWISSWNARPSFAPDCLTNEDWELILPCLEENQKTHSP